MKYILLIYSNESDWTDEERLSCMTESVALCEELTSQGRFIDASPLESIQTATTVRIRQEQTLIIDGPFAETREQLGGYFIVDVNNLDDAIAIAKRIPSARKGAVEVRPLFDLSSLTKE